MKNLDRFMNDDGGNIAVATAILCVPLLCAISLAVDYSLATADRSTMANALDAATLSIMSLPKNASLETRKQKLQEFYVANGGVGTATITSSAFESMGGLTVATAANSVFKTSIAPVTGYSNVNISVATEAYKSPALVEAKFQIDSASGWWGKTMSVFGTRFGSATPVKLLQIDYIYNKGGDPKGYGTTNISTVSQNSSGQNVLTLVEQQVCETKNVTTFNNSPPGAINSTVNGQRKQTTCKKTLSGDAVVDVSEMDKLYLQMDIPKASNPNYTSNPGQATTLRTDSATTSHHLYVDGVEMPQNQVVDIFTIIPCGQQSTQAWEDGGNSLPAPVSNADFFYKVTGKCDFSQRPFGMTLTR